MNRRQVRRFTVIGLCCFAIGGLVIVAMTAQHDKRLRTRVGYALMEVVALRQKIEVFHSAKQHWPTAGDLGIPEWTPYPDGGGYRLQVNGTVQISFTESPELKGHTITLRPTQTADSNKIRWVCSADGEFKPVLLPATCR